MFRSTVVRWILGLLIVVALLGALRFKPWRSFKALPGQSARAPQQLNVGFLPVT
jgi:hypothetical protein